MHTTLCYRVTQCIVPSMLTLLCYQNVAMCAAVIAPILTQIIAVIREFRYPSCEYFRFIKK